VRNVDPGSIDREEERYRESNGQQRANETTGVERERGRMACIKFDGVKADALTFAWSRYDRETVCSAKTIISLLATSTILKICQWGVANDKYMVILDFYIQLSPF
jgi:hypothetical protein